MGYQPVTKKNTLVQQSQTLQSKVCISLKRLLIVTFSIKTARIQGVPGVLIQ